MGLLSNNKSFYPTPSRLAGKMIGKIRGNPGRVLDPSAGKGDLIEYLEKRYQYDRQRLEVYAIEIDGELQATLRGKSIKVIDTDFLAFAGLDKFDLIIANPPFDEGDKHLLKAIDIMYRGQIIFLLNAETIKNPRTNIRKDLAKKLKELNAEIEYIKDAFLDAERQTNVEVALVNINIEKNVEDDLFAGADDKTEATNPEIEEDYELTTRRAIEDLVAEYNQVIQIGVDTIVGYFRNYKKIGKYIGLNKEADKDCSNDCDMTSRMQNHVNEMLAAVRTNFWRRTLDLKEVTKRLTSKKREEFEHQVKNRCDMDFTASNIRQFVLNLIGGHEKTLTDAVLDIFDEFTKRHCCSDGLYDENIHYFNGWKTNKAFKVNKRVVIPVYASYGHPFIGWSGGWKLDWGAASKLHDIDTVMNYFDGMQDGYLSMAQAIEAAFERGQSSKIRSTYFTITAYKKGTVHLAFNDEDILRRFNVAACKGKEWLPHDYGTKSYSNMNAEEKEIVTDFEGVLSYSANLNKPLFAAHSKPQLLQLTA
jgi:hypothetical protein